MVERKIEKVIKKGVKKKLIDYFSRLKKSGIKVEKGLVFGSYAKGSPRPWSDIDVCVISKQFGKDIFEESVKLSRIARQIDPLIEPRLYHPADFKEKYDPLAAEIRKYGQIVYP